MSAKNIYNTVWKLVHADPNYRTSTMGDFIPANQPVIIEHCATSQFLSSDKINYRNDFGMEYEVSVNTYASNNKSQALNLERVGKLTAE